MNNENFIFENCLKGGTGVKDFELGLDDQQGMYDMLLSHIQNSLNKNVKYPLYSEEWLEMAPDSPGIYFVFNKSEIVYVGESANLKKRMNDLRNTYNHTLRRKLGRVLFSKHENYTISSSFKKYHQSIEDEITNYGLKELKVAYVSLVIGRKEMENAFLVKENPPIYNNKPVRSQKIIKSVKKT